MNPNVKVKKKYQYLNMVEERQQKTKFSFDRYNDVIKQLNSEN